MTDAGKRYWQVLEPFWSAIDIYGGPKAFSETYNTVPAVAQTLFAVHFCQSEVCNGGLHQFFANPTGVLAPEAVTGFERIGLPEVATVLRTAMEFFGAPYPRSQDKRNRMLDARQGKTREAWDPFHKLDGEFYAALRGDGERFEKAADEYAASSV